MVAGSVIVDRNWIAPKRTQFVRLPGMVPTLGLIKVSPRFVECCKLPLVAISGRLNAPAVAFADAVTDKVRPEAPICCGNAGEIVTPAGKELASMETAPANPFSGDSVT